MKSRPRALPTTGLRSVHDARTRVYAAGSDPLLSRANPPRTFRLVPAFGPESAAAANANKLWRPEVIDRLQTPISRYHD